MTDEVPHQTIRRWSVDPGNRLVGAVYNRPGHADGRTIMTSRIVEIRLMGAAKTPVAFTESGSAYWLGEPAEGFSARASEFVARMSGSGMPAPTGFDAEETVVLRIVN